MKGKNMKTIFKSLILATLLCSPMLRGAISVNDNISGINLGGGGGGGAVDSVNGLTGTVVLDTDDIAEATAQYFTTARAKSACVSDTAYNATTWDGVTDVSGSKNAIRDQIEVMLTSISGKASSSHTHAATDITSGSLAQARGGLGSDISAVSGVLVNTAGTISGVTAASANTASAIVQRDSNKNFLANNEGLATTSITTSGGTTTLTVASTKRQRFGGASNQNLVLPDATTLGQAGFSFLVDNRSAGVITVKDAGSNTLYTVASGTEALITATVIGTANGTWEMQTAVGQPATDSASGYLSAADHTAYTSTGTIVSAATSANTASAVVRRTADGNVWVTGAQQKATSTATAAGTTTLSITDSPIQIWTGSTTQTIKMPAANTLVQIGATYRFINKSSGTLTIQDNSAGAITTVPTNTSADIVVTNIGSAAGTWIANAAAAGGSGDVVGPASSVDTILPTFDGTTGKLLKQASPSYYIKNNLSGIGINGPVSSSNGVRLWLGSSIGADQTAVSSSSTLGLATNFEVIGDATAGAFTTTLASASDTYGKLQVLTKTDATNNKWTIAPHASSSIGGAASISMTSLGDSVIAHFALTGDKWALLSDNRAPLVLSKSANYTVVAEHKDITILCDATSGAVTITGYASLGHSGWKVTLKKIDSSGNACIYDPNASETADGASTVSITTQWAGKVFQADGTNHLIVGSF